MTTDPDTLFEDAAPTNPVNQPLPVEHPDFKVRVADFPLPWSAASLKDPEEMTPAELLSAYVDCKRMADGLLDILNARSRPKRNVALDLLAQQAQVAG